MLSISPLSGGDQGYYLSLCNLNYYTEGGEQPGYWLGRGAQEFELAGTVVPEHLERLCEGFHHVTGEALVQNAGVMKSRNPPAGEQPLDKSPKPRKPGDDMTFSAPKHLSALFAIADEELRGQIRRAQERAVAKALEAAQDYCGLARVGKDGLRHVDAPLLWAVFPHSTSRAEDPQVHSHCLLLNLTVLENGKPRTIDSTHVYHWKMALGSLYRAELAREVQRLGFNVTLPKDEEGRPQIWTIEGVPDSLVEFWSKRRAEIEEMLLLKTGTLEPAHPRAAEIAALDTRRRKDLEKPLAELVETWREDARAFGFTPQALSQFRSPYQKSSVEQLDELKQRVWTEALARLTYHEAHWSEKDMIRTVADHAAGKLSADEVRELVVHKIRSQELLVKGHLVERERDPGKNQYLDRVESRYTTPLILAMEQRLLETIERLNARPHHQPPSEVLQNVLDRYPTLETEQLRAVEKLTSGAPIRMLSGTAGTGKGFTLSVCHEVWKQEGREVVGIAEAGRTARRLEQDTGIKSDTMAMTLINLNRGKLTLTPNTTVVVDEAGMLGTAAFGKILEHVEKSGAHLVLAGDSWQLQPVTAGAPYKVLANLVPENQLNQIRRQEQQWARDAVHDLKAGRSAEALTKFIEHGEFSLAETRRQAMGQVVERWEQDGGVKNPEQAVMLAGTNAEVRELNRLAQALRIQAGAVDADQKLFVNGLYFHVGDQMVFRHPLKRHGIINGDSGKVAAVDPDRERLTVVLDRDQRTVTVNLAAKARHYAARHCHLAYAQTTNLMQGATIKHAVVLLGGPTQDLHQGYVMGSRAQVSTHLVLDQESAGPDLKDIIRTLGRERRKSMAHEVFAPRRVQPGRVSQARTQERHPEPRPQPPPVPPLRPTIPDPPPKPYRGPTLAP